MTHRNAAFAIPGDINTLTGGYIYERRLLEGLRELGHDVTHIQLGDSFPHPTPAHMAHAVDTLIGLDPARALILDGLVYGAIDTAGLAKVTAPIVAMIHHPLAKETGLSQDDARHLYETEKANLALAQSVLVPSPHTAHILTSEYAVPADRIRIAQPGTDQPSAEQRQSPTEPPLILAVGILHPRKGHDVLVRALAELADVPWRCVIAGSAHDPAYAGELQTLIDTLGLSDTVTLAGRVERHDLAQLYEQATAFALATRYEGYGMVFNEALIWGLPIVTCKAGAVPDTVPDGAGCLVDVDDVAGFATALRTVLSNGPERGRMATASLAAGRALPTWADTAQIASSVLNQLSA